MDTCVISELIKTSPDKNVLAWFERTSEDDVHISSLTLGEIEYGIGRLPDGKKKNDIALWFRDVQEQFKEHTVPVTVEIALEWGVIRANIQKKGYDISVVDGIIAATSICGNFTLATRNTSDFRHLDLDIINPWNTGAVAQ
ncbi:MAG: type II toxin-antitoxin system VapC family toxin [Victivallales bacterium]